jgi:hypothetical protein
MLLQVNRDMKKQSRLFIIYVSIVYVFSVQSVKEKYYPIKRLAKSRKWSCFFDDFLVSGEKEKLEKQQKQ